MTEDQRGYEMAKIGKRLLLGEGYKTPALWDELHRRNAEDPEWRQRLEARL